MDADRFAHERADRHPGVQGRERVLKDELHLAAKPAERGARRGADRLALDAHVARGGRDQARERPCQRGLAAARFADDREGLPTCDGKGYAADGVNAARRAEKAAAEIEFPNEVDRLEDRGHAADSRATSIGA